MLTIALLALLSQKPSTTTPTPECRTSGMNVACGFQCRAELDDGFP